MQQPSSPLGRVWRPDDPRRRRVAEKRDAILDAARPIFLRDGWAGASLERVAAESGISKMTVYRHFRSKQELFEALIAGMCRHILTEPERVGDGNHATLEEQLREEGRAFTAALTEPDALALYRVMISDGWRFPALARTFERSGLAVLRARLNALLIPLGLTATETAVRASGFVNLALGDAYLEASLGLDDPDRPTRFAAQIEAAIGFALH